MLAVKTILAAAGGAAIWFEFANGFGYCVLHAARAPASARPAARAAARTEGAAALRRARANREGIAPVQPSPRAEGPSSTCYPLIGALYATARRRHPGWRAHADGRVRGRLQ